MVQWTPYTKYTEWSPVVSDPSTMDHNLLRINYEVENEIQWIPTSQYDFSFQDFKTSQDTPYNLAMAFITNYERPLVPFQPWRGLQANTWFEYLGGIIPPSPKDERGFPWVLYEKRKRDRNFYY